MGILAALTMTLGNLAALGQDNIKRMLAYSSIAHTGYIMVGLAVFAEAPDPAVAGGRASRACCSTRVAYTFMNLGAFACVAALQRRPGRDQPDLDLRRPRPAGAAAGRRDDPVPAVAGRHPADGRLLRQGCDHPVRGRGWRLARRCWP